MRGHVLLEGLDIVAVFRTDGTVDGSLDGIQKDAIETRGRRHLRLLLFGWTCRLVDWLKLPPPDLLQRVLAPVDEVMLRHVIGEGLAPQKRLSAFGAAEGMVRVHVHMAS